MKTRKMVSKGLLGLLVATILVTASVAQDRSGHGGGKGRHHGKGHGGYHKNRDGKRGDISQRIYDVTQADSVQKIKMKPFVDKASKRVATLRANYQKQEGKVLDSLRAQLKPILKEEQNKKLESFKDHSGKSK